MANSEGALLTVSRARELLTAGFQALEERKQEINDLNVYPVPDGDTGTNLALTMRSLLEAVAQMPETLDGRELCAQISQAALMGARGNSGVILSQIIRGAMEVLGEEGLVTGQTLADAFHNATDTAYRAVRKPVEGTMLTVLREMSEAAAAIGSESDRRGIMAGVISAGWKSVERTPSLLRVLADAGVVDAGGYGLVVIIEGAANGERERVTRIATRLTPAAIAEGSVYAEEPPEEQSEFSYCTSFLLAGQGLSRADIEEAFCSLGDSLLVVGDDRQMKVHIHTDDPGRVVSLATARGTLSEIEIDNMRLQTAARAERLARMATAPADVGQTQVVAVVAGEGNKAVFRSLGVDLIVDGGQSMNPSAEELVRAVQRATAPSIIILPNNSNVVMTAEQTAIITGMRAQVVPSHSIQAGLAAAVAYERRADGEANARAMRAAVENVLSGEVTRAVRDSQVDGVQVKAGDFVGLIDEHVVVSSLRLDEVVEALLGRLLTGGKETLTVLVGVGEDGAQAAAIVEQLRAHYPSVEIDVREGGQPYYPLLLGAE